MWPSREKPSRGAVVLPLIALISWLYVSSAAQLLPQTSRFASQVQALSEAEGVFDTDNLISNERSYLEVMPTLRRKGAGGAFIGVGPDQNFSYIAALRPSVAYIIDVRRDNLLLHLLFKALFAESATRAEYLSNLFGLDPKTIPPQVRGGGFLDLIAHIESRRAREDEVAAIDRLLRARITSFGLTLSNGDYATIDRFHRTFVSGGPALKFQSHGRPPRTYYPTYRELLLQTDGDGRQGNFLAFERDYQFVRSLQLRDRIIPVVGNLAGPTALVAIGRAIKGQGETLSAMYVSNVELYLFQLGLFPKYADNVNALPRTPGTLIIRSIFSGAGSTSTTQRLEEFALRKYRDYWELASP